MVWVARVFDNILGLPLTPPGIEVLEGSELGRSDVLGQVWTFCSALHSGTLHLPYQAVMQPVKMLSMVVFEDLRAHDKSFQPPEGDEVLRAIFTTVWVWTMLIS